MDNNRQVLQFVVDYIEDHIYGHISLDEVACAAGYSKYHLHRMFSTVMGMTIHQYIKRRQLTEAAKELVMTTQKERILKRVILRLITMLRWR